MIVTGKWIDLRKGGSLGPGRYEDCIIVTGTETTLQGLVVSNCTFVPPEESGMCRFFRGVEWEGRAGYAVHEPEVRDAIARKDWS